MVLGQAMESSAGDPTQAGKIRTEFFYDPTLDSIGRSKFCYMIDPNHVKLQPMEDEDMVVQKPVRPYDQYVMFKALTWTGVLTFDQLNCHGVYSIA